ncbi:MAG: class I SAM-dependent methyltransferase [Pseudomonas sp.]
MIRAWLRRSPARSITEQPCAPVAQAPQADAGFVDSRDCGLVDSVQSGWYRNATGELFEGFAITAEDVVVDVGCGIGGATIFCANQGAHIIFTDTERSKVTALEQRLQQSPARRFEGIVSDSNPLPLPAAHASRVIALEVLEHVDEPALILRELYRIGQPGALYLLAVPDPVCEHIQKGIAPSIHFERPNHIHIFQRDEFERLVAGAGLQIESRAAYSFYWSMWMLIYWASTQADGKPFVGATHDAISPPYPPLLNDWARLWYQLINMPDGGKIRSALDQVMPKSQIIIARKPWTAE